MSKSQREKGIRGELDFARAAGGHRVPLSGAVKGYEGDVVALDLKWQVKVRGDGFVRLYDWLKGHDALAVKADRHQWLVVIPLDTLLNMLPADGAGAQEKGVRDG